MTPSRSRKQFIAYGKGQNFKRLQEIKAKYDPTNFLTQNNNIVPAGMEGK